MSEGSKKKITHNIHGDCIVCGAREMPKALEAELDAGIRDYVRILYQHGVETCQSCEGGVGHCYPEPTIEFFGSPAAGWKAFAVARDHALPVRQLNRFWSIEDGEPVGPHWSMTFWRKAKAKGGKP